MYRTNGRKTNIKPIPDETRRDVESRSLGGL